MVRNGKSRAVVAALRRVYDHPGLSGRGGTMNRMYGFVTIALLTSIAARADVPTYEATSDARPDGRSLTVDSLLLKRDVFTFKLGPGTLHFLSPSGGATFGAVWLGPGSMTLEPATEGERRYLAQQTNRKDLTVLDDSFD